jgi:23S rRNA pseudouridine2604 synthase
VTINGRVANLGDQVGKEDAVTLDGRPVVRQKTPVYIKYHKPVGITTTSEPDVPDNIIAAIGHPERIFPIGRLDKDSSGLILLTNDGEIVNRILRAEHGHEREYLVQVDRPYDSAFLQNMARGVMVLGSLTRPCRTMPLKTDSFRIILTEGRNRQIRRMCQAVGYRVIALHRVRIMHIELGQLRAGQWRDLSDQEIRKLFSALRKSEGHQLSGGTPSPVTRHPSRAL